VGVGISGDDWNAWHNRYVVEEEGEERVDERDGAWNGYCDFDGDGKKPMAHAAGTVVGWVAKAIVKQCSVICLRQKKPAIGRFFYLIL
jgi:hypothetical protein